MARNRKAFTESAIADLALIDRSGANSAIMKEQLDALTDAEFHAYVEECRAGKNYLSIIMDNLNNSKINVENNLAIASKFGIEFFQRIWTTDAATGLTYLTNQKYLVCHLPVRRQIQTLENKISIPSDNQHIDELTDQPRDDSKGAAVSFPELLVLYAQGHSSSIQELMKVRGGDLTAMNNVDKQIHETGGATLASVMAAGTVVKSTQTFSTLLKGMHYDNNYAS
jgi:hypothetical protein